MSTGIQMAVKTLVKGSQSEDTFVAQALFFPSLEPWSSLGFQEELICPDSKAVLQLRDVRQRHWQADEYKAQNQVPSAYRKGHMIQAILTVYLPNTTHSLEVGARYGNAYLL